MKKIGLNRINVPSYVYTSFVQSRIEGILDAPEGVHCDVGVDFSGFAGVMFENKLLNYQKSSLKTVH